MMPYQISVKVIKKFYIDLSKRIQNLKVREVPCRKGLLLISKLILKMVKSLRISLS